MDEKQLKREVLRQASSSPESFFPVKTLKAQGFSRHQCSACKRFFWSVHSSSMCGDPACSGGFRFIGKKRKKQLEYLNVWREFASVHKKLGYSPISRYPVISRWNPTTDFTIASIAAFQPFVVSGEVAPPANPLVIPQMCLRFPDIDNVGITGHHVAFVMMGEHGFFESKEYDVDRFFGDHLSWLKKGMGLSVSELRIHEDVWAGGGNLGPSMEFFVDGLEISNQVYMQYEVTPSGLKDLKIKVLDMGQGQERAAWFTQGKSSIYECSFGPIVHKLREVTGVEYDDDVMKRFTPLSPYLNVDEALDMAAAWKRVATSLEMDVSCLRKKVLPLAGLYSVAEHSRALLFAITDGGLPSNVGGMYNLRVILRRALGFIDKFKWSVKLPEVCAWHADYLQPLFPEVVENLEDVFEILEVEREKYVATRQKTQGMLPRLLDRELSPSELVTLYDSHGIAPEVLKDEAQKMGKVLFVPENFYALVAERHVQKEQEHATSRSDQIPIGALPLTKALYFDDYAKTKFKAKVLEIVDKRYVVLDETAFYPTSGGQLSDRGTLNGERVVDVFKQGGYIVHVLSEPVKFKAGEVVEGEIDFSRRTQLAQHHTATHIVNAAARMVLGRHVNQAGAKKDIDKAHIDLTHYELPSDDELSRIEKEANRIVKAGMKTKLSFMPREDAEKVFGMGIYQGGVAPGKLLRIVNIPGVDVEACGGTHVHNTQEVGVIKIVKASKVKDGIVRLVFTAGRATQVLAKEEHDVAAKAAVLLKCDVSQVPGRAAELFALWKEARKLAKKGEFLSSTTLKSEDSFDGDVVVRTAQVLQTQPEHVIKTIERFLRELSK